MFLATIGSAQALWLNPSLGWKYDDSLNLQAYIGGKNFRNISTNFSTGKYGQAGYYDGLASTLINSSSNWPILTAEGTISAWVWMDDADPGNYERVITWRATNGTANGFQFGIFDDKLSSFDGTTECNEGSTAFPTGRWVHIALRWNATDVRMYQDGALETTCAAFAMASLAEMNLTIGSNANVQFFDGRIDEIWYFNYSLTADQIDQINDSTTGLQLSSIAITTAPTNNTQFNTNQITINATINSTDDFDLKLYINNVLNQTVLNTSARFNDLVAWWRFDEGSGTTAIDSSGNNNNGAHGNNYSDARIETYSLNFTGASGRVVSIPHSMSLNLTSSGTWGAWVRWYATDSNDRVIDKNGRYYIEVIASIGRVDCGNTGLSDTYLVGTGTALTQGTWSYIVCTYNGTTVSVYQNGVLKTSEPATGNISVDGSNLTISGVGSRVFNGSIDDVRVYSRALSADEIWQLYQNTNGSVRTYIFNYTFPSSFESNYTYYFNANNSGNNITSTPATFYIDSLFPTITWFTPNTTNNTVVGGANLTVNINVTDGGLFSWYLNISYINGSLLANRSNVTLTGRSNVNIGESIYTGGAGSPLRATVRVCDGHTALSIKDFGARYEGDQFSFAEREENIRIEPDDNNKVDVAGYQKKDDKYSFSYRTKTLSTQETFTVRSDQEIHILSGKTKYPGHLVTGEKWIDFMSPDIESVTITRVSSKVVKVTVTKKNPTTSWDFDSIGELNCITESKIFYAVNTTQTGSSVVLAGATETFNLTVSYNSTYINRAITASLVYNGTSYAVTGTNTSSFFFFSKNLAIPSFTADANVSYYWAYTINGVAYNTSTQTQAVFSFALDNCSTYNRQFINFTIREEVNDTIVVGNSDVTVDFYNDNYTFTYATQFLNRSNFALCLYPANLNVTFDMLLQYGATGYGTRDYIRQGAIADNFTDYVNLYLLQSDLATEVTVSVVDASEIAIPDLLVEMYLYDIAANNDSLVETDLTDNQGNFVSLVRLNGPYYSFKFYQGGQLVYTTPRVKIFGTDLKYRISDGGFTHWDIFREMQNAVGTITFNNNTQIFSGSWDYSGVDTEGFTILDTCLKISRVVNDTGLTVLHNLTCSTNMTGLISIVAPSSLSDIYEAQLYTNISASPANPYILDTDGYSYEDGLGLEGLFWGALVVLALFFSTTIHPVAPLLLMGLGIIIMTYLGLFAISTTIAISILVTLAIIGVLMRQ